MEALDLLQIHCLPRPVLDDGAIFGWLDDMQKDGLVRAWGASVETLAEADICLAQPGLASLQIIFNLFRQDAAASLLARSAAADVGIIVRLPLASGLLTGKFGKDTTFDAKDHRNYNRDGAAFSVGETFSGISFGKGLELVEALDRLIPDGWTMAQVALRWLLDQPEVSTVIAGASKPGQVVGNAEASMLPPLPDALRAQLADFYMREVREAVRCEI